MPDGNMLLVKAWYFFYFASLVLISPFVNLYLEQNGLSAAQIGVLAALRPWVNAPAAFAWSALADARRAHAPILRATLVASTLLSTSMAFLHTFPAFLALAVASTLVGAPVCVLADAAVMKHCREEGGYGKVRLWGAVGWGVFSTVAGVLMDRMGMAAGFAASFLMALPSWALCSGFQHELPPPEPKAGAGAEVALALLAAQQRHEGGRDSSSAPAKAPPPPPPPTTPDCAPLWGADHPSSAASGGGEDAARAPLSALTSPKHRHCHGQPPGCAATAAPAAAGDAAPVVDAGSEPSPDQRCASTAADARGGGGDAPAVGTPCRGAAAGAAKRAAGRAPAGAGAGAGAAGRAEAPARFWGRLRALLARPAVRVFVGQATVMGFGIGVIGEMLFLFLRQLGGSDTLMGLSLTITCVSEIPSFHYQGAVIKRMGVPALLHVTLATYVLRLALYALLPLAGTPWAVLPIEVLHGITFGFGWGVGTVNCKRVAPAGLEATMQGIFTATYFGVGQGLGGLIGGVLMQRYGGQAMFGMCACICLAGWAACWGAERWSEVGGGGGGPRYAALGSEESESCGE